MKEDITIIALMVSLVINLFLGVFSYREPKLLKEQAIKNNCAQYNPITGSFEWIEKEEVE